jgi:hypothetical protein
MESQLRLRVQEIPFPELPAVDKDEQEFEEWFKAHESEYCTDITKAALKHGWMAARGKK